MYGLPNSQPVWRKGGPREQSPLLGAAIGNFGLGVPVRKNTATVDDMAEREFMRSMSSPALRYGSTLDEDWGDEGEGDDGEGDEEDQTSAPVRKGSFRSSPRKARAAADEKEAIFQALLQPLPDIENVENDHYDEPRENGKGSLQDAKRRF